MTKQGIINILITANDSYFESCLVTINSLFINNNAKLSIHLMHCEDMNESNINIIKNFVENENAIFASYFVNGLDWLNGKTRYWDKIIMLKLYAWEILPDDIDKILYLDADTLVIDSISELYRKNVDDYYFAMRGIDETTDMSGVYGKHIKTGHTNYVIKKNRFDTHYNAGVILYNLKKLRDEQPKWKDFFLENYMRLFCPEEHLMCALWYNKIIPIEDKWNHITKAHYKERPFILHYIPKPWISGEVYYIKEYLYYCNIPECQRLYKLIKSHINAPYPHSKEAFLNSWLHIEMNNSDYFKSFFSARQYKKIAVYGVGEISELFCYKYTKVKGINIEYFIDNESSWKSFNGKKIIKIEEIEKEKNIDAIIITPYERFLEIEMEIQKQITHKIDIVSIIEIIYF
jgi:lipopolysaccharide biosynthesis glycosyltransferase